ncbi:MAG: PepSY domain-containing protein [Desulfomicrobium sp.]|uniref:NADPH--hemoprotein reductase n=2 Tax=Alphaproteobacteria TaxID=28211 RepID=A0A376AIB9_9HYPH|nr:MULTISPECIES: PepSY domain-containing protein [Alphaproteobacteria]MBU4530832.1 PepSY domain-containing protein [Alphaproteobacteria bacterium]MBV1712590.1 PepSY domain-containing protein [Desulfomicrobium sp.]KFE33364.1 oxidoreductase FAD-binding subunit [Thioclava atlantica]MBU4542962.1 PepSY domain-containing protein [Alphaproteobacteria bacterium]MBU4549805.1 PepSY domain-containing protein [Alphaproteobacteria bacterium]
MIRALHRWPGLLALVLVTVLALSGAALSVFPMAERLVAPQAVAGQSVADMAARVAATHPGLEEIRRSPSGTITAWWFDGGTPGSAVIDPATGADVGSADPNPVERWLTNLHRSLFLDDAGRLVMAAGAAAMLVLALSGAALVARRTGGWRRGFARLRGPLVGRLHVELARVAVMGLALSAATALWMTASTFDLLPDGAVRPADPAAVSGQMAFPLGQMAALQDVPVSALRKLSFPYAGDAQDVFTLSTDAGTGLIDQGTGELLSWADLTPWQQVSETIYMLHTGQGAAVLGLVLGLIALSVPVMGVTGALIWVAGRRGRPHLRDNARASRAQTVILVGSEGGSTWGFAATLARALRDAGQAVHVGPMSAFDPARCPRADRFLILAATYGEGDAPASARGFLDRLARMAPTAPLAVLGFGDRSFPAYCAFAAEVDAAARAMGWTTLLPMDTVDRQSPQDFARWGRALGQANGLTLDLDHQPARPEAQGLTLISRRDYGEAVQAPTAILRFALPKATLWARLTGRGFARFQAGDLLGILPEGSTVPRFYSLASGSRDGFVEIVVKKHPGGLCSGQLLALEPGDAVQAFLRRNPGFHAGRGRAPLILIGAGTGIGPLAGIIRANARHRPVHLFFGMRHPDSDFLYGDDLTAWQAEGRLTQLSTAVSRGARPHYVQDALRAEAAQVAEAIRQGAKVMVCGGRDMGRGVGRALEDILAPMGLTPAMLKAGGRYVEDVY